MVQHTVVSKSFGNVLKSNVWRWISVGAHKPDDCFVFSNNMMSASSSSKNIESALKARRPSLLALPRSFHLLRCVQVAKHLRLEPETSKLILFQRLHLRVGEKQINFVPALVQSIFSVNGKLPPIHRAQRLPTSCYSRDSRQCPRRACLQDQIL